MLRNLEVIGGRKTGLTDVYHFLIGASWWRVIAAVSVVFVVVNMVFGLAFLLTDGVKNLEPGHYLEACFFSVETLATIGYGARYPDSTSAHLLVSIEALVGILGTAMITGLVFAKFARPKARVMFAQVAVISEREGVPTLMFRVANERRNHVVEANLRVGLIRAEVTAEGEHIRRVHDVPLLRSQSPAFILTWTVMHPIVPGSPLYGQTPATLQAQQVEIVLTLTGIDETLSQTIHARHSYIASELVFAARFSDVLSTAPGTARRVIDYNRFHEHVPGPLSLAKMGVVSDPAKP